MRVFLENFNADSDSGPNGFAKKLFTNLHDRNLVEFSTHESADVSFCLIQGNANIGIPRVLRLDGIYFNREQDYTSLNGPIKSTYDNSDSIIFQTQFNKRLIESWFGVRERSFVIRNGTDHTQVSNISPIRHEILDGFREIWTCAAAWRPHKRLDENIRYFLEFAPQDAALIVMGKDAERWLIHHPRILYVGHVPWHVQVSICRRSSTFLHLAWLDHCPNVVVDAQAAGCKIVCSTAGGTCEIAGPGATLVVEEDWDFSPINLYQPPRLDFNRIMINKDPVTSKIEDVADLYMDVLRGVKIR